MLIQPLTLQAIQAAFPKFTIKKSLGPSGQKVALHVTDDSGRDFALKLVRPDPLNTEYLKREVAIVQRMGLPYVPSIKRVGDVTVAGADFHFVIEDFVDGKPLNEVLKGGPLPSEEVHRLMEVLLLGCAAFERENIVHRDIKPHNIIRGADGRFWVIDFGLVRMLDEVSITATGKNFGPCTIGYGAPEQMRNQKRKIDSKTDLFSTGLTIYECVSGSNPHLVGKDPLQRMQSITTQDLPPLDERDGLSRPFLDFVGSLCNRKRSARPASAQKALDVYTSNFKPE